MPAESGVGPLAAAHRVADAPGHRLAGALDVVGRTASFPAGSIRGAQLLDERVELLAGRGKGDGVALGLRVVDLLRRLGEPPSVVRASPSRDHGGSS